MSITLRLIRWLLGLLFLWAAVSKLSEINVFYTSLARSGIVPLNLAVPLTLAVPTLELTVAVFLLIERKSKPAVLVATGLLLIFLAWQVTSLLRGDASGCACFKLTAVKHEIFGPKLRIVRALVLCGMAGFLLYGQVIRGGRGPAVVSGAGDV